MNRKVKTWKDWATFFLVVGAIIELLAGIGLWSGLEGMRRAAQVPPKIFTQEQKAQLFVQGTVCAYLDVARKRGMFDMVRKDRTEYDKFAPMYDELDATYHKWCTQGGES